MSDWFAEGRSGGAVDAVALLDSGSSDLLFQLVAAGALVSLSVTSDGGALGVTITVDGRWRREYFRDSESLFEWLGAAMGPVTDACRARAASGAGVQRQRSRNGR